MSVSQSGVSQSSDKLRNESTTTTAHASHTPHTSLPSYQTSINKPLFAQHPATFPSIWNKKKKRTNDAFHEAVVSVGSLVIACVRPGQRGRGGQARYVVTDRDRPWILGTSNPSKAKHVHGILSNRGSLAMRRATRYLVPSFSSSAMTQSNCLRGGKEEGRA